VAEACHRDAVRSSSTSQNPALCRVACVFRARIAEPDDELQRECPAWMPLE
jgi:hypothetical protein